MGTIGFAEIVVLLGIAAVASVCIVWPAWRVIARMGFPGPLALVALVPLGGWVLLVIFAIIDGPVHRELRALQEKQWRA